jgi:hypothetical protein
MAAPPEQFQFGIRRIWLDCLETNTEAYEAVAETGGVVAALSRTQETSRRLPRKPPRMTRKRARCRTLGVSLSTSG